MGIDTASFRAAMSLTDSLSGTAARNISQPYGFEPSLAPRFWHGILRRCMEHGLHGDGSGTSYGKISYRTVLVRRRSIYTLLFRYTSVLWPSSPFKNPMNITEGHDQHKSR